MSCETNINNGYNNVLFKTGILDKNSKHLNKDRSLIFYGICIPVRTLLAISVYCLCFIKSEKIQTRLSYMFALISLYSFIHLATKSKESLKCQWWSNSLEMFIALMLFLTSVYCIIKNKPCTVYVSIILGTSIISGLLQSFIIKPFK